jgi:hypothetical protein
MPKYIVVIYLTCTRKKLQETIIMVQVFSIAITESMEAYVGDVLDKPNDADPTLCVGENQSNVLRTQPPMTFALNSLPSLRFGCGSNMQGVNTSSEEPPR